MEPEIILVLVAFICVLATATKLTKGTMLLKVAFISMVFAIIFRVAG